MDAGLGPRQYEVEPEHLPFLQRRSTKVVGATLLVLAIGGGAFGVTQAFSGSSSSPPASATPPASGGGNSAVPGSAAHSRVVGTVEKVGSTSFTAQTRANGTVTVEVNSATTFRSVSGATDHLSDLKIGDAVAAVVTPSGSMSVATEVTISPAGSGSFGGGRSGGGFGGGRFGSNFTVGVVQSIGKSTFTIRGRASGSSTGSAATSTFTVEVNSSTTIEDRATGVGAFSDIKVGDTVLVSGTKTGSTVNATLVGILPSGGSGGGGFGGGFGGRAAGSSGAPASS